MPWLDAHNLFGVLGLPFHLCSAYTGIVIFMVNYMPAGMQVAYKNDVEHFFSEVMGAYHREEMHQPAPAPKSLDVLIAQSRQRWQGWRAGLDQARITRGMPLAVVDIRRYSTSRIGAPQDTLTYDAGRRWRCCTSSRPRRATAPTTRRPGLHMAQFGGSLVRLLYLLMGLAACAMLVGGLQVWIAKREARGGAGVALVRELNGAVFVGLPLASLALLWGNRLIPATLAERASYEAGVFVASWLLVALWAVLGRRQPRRLLSRQLALGALLALGLPLLNGLSSEHGHLLGDPGAWRLGAGRGRPRPARRRGDQRPVRLAFRPAAAGLGAAWAPYSA